MRRFAGAFIAGVACGYPLAQVFQARKAANADAPLAIAPNESVPKFLERANKRVEHLERQLVALKTRLDCRHANSGDCSNCSDCIEVPPDAKPLSGYEPPWRRAEREATRRSETEATIDALTKQMAPLETQLAAHSATREWARAKLEQC